MSFSRANRLIVLGVLALMLTGGAQARLGPSLQLVPVVTGLSSPLYVTAPSNERNTIYVVEKGGVVRAVVDGTLQPGSFLDIHTLVSNGGEQGLLSIAFSPIYVQDRLFYVDYTDTNGDTRVVEFRSTVPARRPTAIRQLLKVVQPYANHNGGQLQFGPDGKLYVGMGDGGSAGDPQNYGQNLSSNLAKLLRAGPPGWNWEIYGYGLRNPWRFSFDRATGDLYLADVGQKSWEEIDYRRAGASWANYGWSRYEGLHVYKSTELNPAAPLVWPVVEYPHTEGCSVIGGYVYRGPSMVDQRGRYFYGDLCSGTIWSMKIVSGRAADVRVEPITVPKLASFGEDAAGELYAVSLSGTVYRISE